MEPNETKSKFTSIFLISVSIQILSTYPSLIQPGMSHVSQIPEMGGQNDEIWFCNGEYSNSDTLSKHFVLQELESSKAECV